MGVGMVSVKDVSWNLFRGVSVENNIDIVFFFQAEDGIRDRDG